MIEKKIRSIVSYKLYILTSPIEWILTFQFSVFTNPKENELSVQKNHLNVPKCTLNIVQYNDNFSFYNLPQQFYYKSWCNVNNTTFNNITFICQTFYSNMFWKKYQCRVLKSLKWQNQNFHVCTKSYKKKSL